MVQDFTFLNRSAISHLSKQVNNVQSSITKSVQLKNQWKECFF